MSPNARFYDYDNSVYYNQYRFTTPTTVTLRYLLLPGAGCTMPRKEPAVQVSDTTKAP